MGFCKFILGRLKKDIARFFELCHSRHMKTLNIAKINRLLQDVPISEIAKATGIPRRTLFRIKAGTTPSLKTLLELAKWAKDKR